MKNAKRPLACALALAVLWSSFPGAAYGQSVLLSRPVNAQTAPVAGLSSAAQVRFASGIASLSSQLSILPSFSALQTVQALPGSVPASSAAALRAAFIKDAVAFIDAAAPQGGAESFEVEAGRAVKGALLDPQGYGARIIADLGKKDGDQASSEGTLAAEALSLIAGAPASDAGSRSAIAAALAGLRLDAPGTLDALYDRLRTLEAGEFKPAADEAPSVPVVQGPRFHHISNLSYARDHDGPTAAEVLGRPDEVIGLIGVGKQGQRHLDTLVTHGVRVRAVDRTISDELRAQYASSDALSLEQGDASEVLADPRVKAVIIVTPGNTHHAIAKQALLAGKNVLVEKPFTQTAEQAEELVALAEARGLILMVGHNRYYLPHLQRLKDMIAGGKLGKILSVEGHYLNPPQKFDRTHTALEGLGYHQLYMIDALMGQDGPSKLVGAVSSESRETVGLKLMYGEVPVTVKLSREYDGRKTRDIVVVGSEFTATFDYGGEPAFTRLEIRPTPHALSDEQAAVDEAALAALREQSAFKTEAEAEPSLDHQLRAFLKAVRTQETPPSSGRMAIRVVETLDGVRAALGASGVYYADPKVSAPLIVRLAREIHDRLGDKGGMVAIDGTAGVGKSTMVRALADLYELMYPKNRSMVDNLDEVRFPMKICLALKRRILGEDLTDEEERILKEHGWETVRPGEPFVDEESLWRNDVVELELKEMRKLFDVFAPEEQVIVTRKSAYVSRDSKRFYADKQYVYRPGDVVFIDGKSANRESFSGYTDLHVRLRDALDAVRKRFERDRGVFLNPVELAKHMDYYAKVILPSWLSYDERTRANIDLEVDIPGNEIHRLH
ncbi:MAG: Gfo/Idh/MocA family oxidoreductase [Elusimicrobiota bacterium]